MGQAPGTHWYHAHKHGSTALNVGNGMTGTFVIEGAYDDRLRSFYRETPGHENWGLQEQVLVIQQLESALNLLSPDKGPAPPLSVNGRLNPVVTRKPNQVQLWGVVNAAACDFVQFDSFALHGSGEYTHPPNPPGCRTRNASRVTAREKVGAIAIVDDGNVAAQVRTAYSSCD